MPIIQLVYLLQYGGELFNFYDARHYYFIILETFRWFWNKPTNIFSYLKLIESKDKYEFMIYAHLELIQ